MPPPGQPGKSLYTTIREFVENSLDAAESINSLPEITISIQEITEEDLYKLKGVDQAHRRVNESLYLDYTKPDKASDILSP